MEDTATTTSPADTTPTVCCSAAYRSGYGINQFSIVQRTRQGRKFFEAEWLPTGCRRRFATKREAVVFVKEHEDRCFGQKKGTK